MTISNEEPESMGNVFRKGYNLLFRQEWPLWIGGFLFGMLNVFMFAYEKPWSVADEIRNWRNWFFKSINVSA